MAGNETFRASPTNLKPTAQATPGKTGQKPKPPEHHCKHTVTKEETTQGQTTTRLASPTPKRVTDRGWQRRKPEPLTVAKTEARDKERQTLPNKPARQTKPHRPRRQSRHQRDWTQNTQEGCPEKPLRRPKGKEKQVPVRTLQNSRNPQATTSVKEHNRGEKMAREPQPSESQARTPANVPNPKANVNPLPSHVVERQGKSRKATETTQATDNQSVRKTGPTRTVSQKKPQRWARLETPKRGSPKELSQQLKKASRHDQKWTRNKKTDLTTSKGQKAQKDPAPKPDPTPSTRQTGTKQGNTQQQPCRDKNRHHPQWMPTQGQRPTPRRKGGTLQQLD